MADGRRSPRALVRAGTLALVLAGATSACGSSQPKLTLDPLPSSTTTTEVRPPTTVAEVTGPAATASAETTGDGGPATSVEDAATRATADAWVDAAANLAGLKSECGNLSFVSAHPARDQVIAGVALNGLWQSADDAPEWTALGTGEGSATITHRLSSIVYDPADPDRFWESGTYGTGVYRTDDGGTTFVQLGDIDSVDLVSVDLTDPDRQTLLAGIHEQPVVQRSDDGGETWVDVSAGLPADVGFASSPHVIDATTFLLGTQNGEASGVFRTTDAGATWTQVFDAGVIGPPVQTADGALTWLLKNGLGVIRSTDGGTTWEAIAAKGWIDKNATTLVAMPDGRLATFGGGTIVTSDDGGRNWSVFGPPLPYRPNGVTFAPDRSAFYAWAFDCTFGTDNPVRSDSIVRLDVDRE